MPNGRWFLGGTDDCLASIQLLRSGFFFSQVVTRTGVSQTTLQEAQRWCEAELIDMVREIQNALGMHGDGQ